ncbi:MAG: LeuD/DmdB family oxidoreductase small subunit [Candidatus Syntropharchaeales archaeon]|nr:3-isopropylmalate dehydratase [Candidatus Syntrophoarchaeum sp.]
MKGRVWKFGDNVDTDQIIPAEYLVTGDPKELARYAFCKVRGEFAKEVREGDIIVGGSNFGSGSSREHAPRALIGAGISCVIAASFARIYFRNSINIGLPPIECKIRAEDGDILEVDLGKGLIRNTTSGESFNFKPLPGFLQEMVDAGGLIEWLRSKPQ